MTNILELVSICRRFREGDGYIDVLKNLSLSISEGEIVALTGPSGSGKSTLLQIAGLLEKPDSGTVIFNSRDLSNASDAECTIARKSGIGFIYQFHHLFPEFSALENIMMPLLINGADEESASKKAHTLLNSLGIQHRANHRPGKLSGGEQQRVAILRAIAVKPKLILADEPTGNLDPENSHTVFDLFKKLAKENGIAALVATHNIELANKMDRVFSLSGNK